MGFKRLQEQRIGGAYAARREEEMFSFFSIFAPPPPTCGETGSGPEPPPPIPSLPVPVPQDPQADGDAEDGRGDRMDQPEYRHTDESQPLCLLEPETHRGNDCQ